PRLVVRLAGDLVLEASGQRAPMPTGHDLDHDPPVLDPLHRLVTGVDTQLLADGLLNRDLSPLSYSACHNMNLVCRYVTDQPMRLTRGQGIAHLGPGDVAFIPPD